jgi:hypothetical protein
MKKTVFGFVLILGIMASLSSCSTNYKMVVDENIPMDRSATVTFEGYLKSGFFRHTEGSFIQVKEHNDRNISDDLYGGRETSSADKTILTVPAGNNRFLFDVSFGYGYSSIGIIKISNLEIRYDLEPGKKYIITGFHKRTKSNLLGMDDYDLCVGIYDVTTGKKTLLREWKVGERGYKPYEQ